MSAERGNHHQSVAILHAIQSIGPGWMAVRSPDRPVMTRRGRPPPRRDRASDRGGRPAREDDGDARDGERDDVGDDASSSLVVSTRATMEEGVARVEGRRRRDDGGCHRRAGRAERRALARR